MLRQR
jgi:hypothetical protein